MLKWSTLTRLISAEKLLNDWREMGIENGEIVLQEFGFYNEDDDLDLDNIDVEELSKMLQVIRREPSIQLISPTVIITLYYYLGKGSFSNKTSTGPLVCGKRLRKKQKGKRIN